MPGVRVVEIRGLAELQAKCKDNSLYERPGKRALQQIAKQAEGIVKRAAPRGPTGKTGGMVFSKVNNRVPGPRWAVVGTKATATPANPYTRSRRSGRRTKYPYAYPRRLEFDPKSRHKDWLLRAVQQARGAISGALSQAAKEIEAQWGSR